jgi:hypothetical protein
MDRRRANIERVFSDRPVQLRMELLRYEFEERVRILREIAWLKYHRRDALVAEGLAVAKRRKGATLFGAASLIVSDMMPLHAVRNVRRWLLSG